MIAAENNNLDIVMALLRAGADINAESGVRYAQLLFC